ncbi:choline ABC transporter substrate-binding protein [Ancylobacter rudongensis]|uniref:Glycine betaine/proline transport system substrate-binding protein n=1 Tax=Ancylobacter rudongensis TaxID=177413 RepID=A0A1G4TIQ4_9HYPH|nr:choline ABC transporter substrate-binding protein [Ancylobacter rudongensis]SCW81167.1 glycine betaine/proline transport system substrate-binding protein [Ancylobacter rudongensis]
MTSRFLVTCAALSAVLLSSPAFAVDPTTCAKPRFSDVGWTDITATTAVASELLKHLGYKPDVAVLSVAITFKALENGDRDIFLGNWMPLQEPTQVPLVKDGKIDVVATNLDGARIGFATSKAAYDAGLKTYADIAKFKDKLQGKIYGIEAGSGANATISKMIAEDTFGLKGFDLVESSEQAMLTQVGHRIKQGEPVVFFGWRPHPMNVNLPIAYLTDGNDVFGPKDGGASVLTLTRPGYTKDCPNVGKLLTNLVFDVAMEDRLMSDILDKGMQPEAAVTAWMKQNPAAVDGWLAGVTTLDGKPGAAAVKAGLGL